MNMAWKRQTIVATDDDHSEHNDGFGTATQEAQPKLKRPPLYCVLMMNDDYTPMEFVVHVLQQFFGKGLEQATQIMLTVHTKGSAVCGVYTRDVAETKCQQVNQYAQENEHPLLCTVEVQSDGEEE